MILPPLFFQRESVTVARELLGKRLVVFQDGIILSGIINETEAYRGKDDPASHAHPGMTERNRIMYETYGHTYVYFVYGMHYCLNFTCEDTGSPGAVLIRSIIPVQGRDVMVYRRGGITTTHISDGPGKLCQALGITRNQNGLPLTPGSGIYLEDTGYSPGEIIQSQRIGIRKWQEKDWRFYFPEL